MMIENWAPNGSVIVASRPYRKSFGPSELPPVSSARRTASSVPATSNVVLHDDAPPGAPMMPPTSWPSGRRRNVKFASGMSSFRSRVKSKTSA